MAKDLAAQNNIRVENWGITGDIDSHNLEPGMVLNTGNTKQDVMKWLK